ncbi:ribosomal protection-like ABC-F family protein [Clostridium tagluense]|uniref:ABC transporter ATP-binding protein n=1 Tax=Clostridium tagluense TaxID=360422 RepID=A0A401UPT5_9CLOT|nr:ABC-F type ribosomal protection protein [Clostridium tagluense]GCD11518.1 ABC transporter ATP-binding protein [Clostridium tagluense]
MTILFKNITKIYEGKTIFQNISGKINDKDKVGIIGINGIGKTTLIKILVEEENCDSGTVEILPSDIKIGYLKQSSDFDEDITLSEKIQKYKTKYIYKYSQDKNLTYEKALKKSLTDMGFNDKDLKKKISKLSGGEKTKLSICLVLMNDPEVLILDEPTNHLDVDAIKWLENFLSKLNKTIIIISHDRLFLDNTVNKIFEMNYDKIEEYSGNYSHYKYQKNINIANINKEHSKQQREIKHLGKVIQEQRQWFDKAHKSAGTNDHLRKLAGKHMNTVWSKEKKLEKILENKIDPYKANIPAAFYLINKNNINKSKLPNYLIRINRLKKSFDSKVIFDNAACNLKKGDKVALLGSNGSGKITLLKMIIGSEKPNSGTVYIPPSIRLAYFSQELENLNYDNRILDEVMSLGICRNDARLMLGSLLFKSEDVFKAITKLSMGEKCRVAFAKLLLSGSDILILDEPTNYMDTVSKENIEEVLKQYEGTILFVSHDRYFINSLATKIFEIDNQKIITYEGDYDYYLNKKAEMKDNVTANVNYDKIKDEILQLECELAFLCGKLSDVNLLEYSKIETQEKFLGTYEKLRECKYAISNDNGLNKKV